MSVLNSSPQLLAELQELKKQVEALERNNPTVIQTDSELLNWLQGNLDRFDIQCDLSKPNPFWFTRLREQKLVEFGHGRNLREAIRAAIKSETI